MRSAEILFWTNVVKIFRKYAEDFQVIIGEIKNLSGISGEMFLTKFVKIFLANCNELLGEFFENFCKVSWYTANC